MLRGEYVRSRQQVKALGMGEVSVADPAAICGESRVPSTYTEGRQGFGPFVEERDDRVAVPESLRAPLRAVASSGCERDSGADGASAPSSPWIGATESDPGVGERGIVDSSSRDETTALIDAMSTDLTSAADCRVDSTALIDAHEHGDPPRIGDSLLYIKALCSTLCSTWACSLHCQCTFVVVRTL